MPATSLGALSYRSALHVVGLTVPVLLGDRILVLSTGPGRVRQILDNPTVGQRDSEASIKMQRDVQEIIGE